VSGSTSPVGEPHPASAGERGRATGRRDLVALGATIVVLVAWNLGRRAYVPDRAHLPANFAMAFVFGALGVAGGLDWSGFGLRRDRILRGLAYGGVVFAVVLAGLVLAGALSATSDLLADDRVHVGTGSMLFEVLVAIPFGTVVLEELAFRGTLLGLLRRRLPTVPAVAVSAVLFGFWHLNGVIRASGGGIAVGAAVGTVAATTVAGIGFAWLRVRSDSLVAPIVAHIATNSLTFAVAWAYAR
jgi:membrane protease YdiL (CAAX protease family)